MDVALVSVMIPIVAIIAGVAYAAFTKWAQTRERIAIGAGTDEVLRRLDRLEEDVARLRRNMIEADMREPVGTQSGPR